VPGAVPRSSRPRDGDRGWWGLLALGVVCLVCGGVALVVQTAEASGQQDAGILPEQGVVQVQPAGLVAGVAPRVGSSRRVAPAPPPVRLRLPRLNVDARVLPVSVGVDGLLGVPDNPRQLGWWSASGRPGMPSGSVVIDGHVDSAALGLGALFQLSEARPGDDVILTNAGGRSTRYTVVARRSYAKTSLPVAEVFAANVGPRLVLLTCGGPFDEATRHYADNIVVYAVPR
jgi:hypothetical protein